MAKKTKEFEIRLSRRHKRLLIALIIIAIPAITVPTIILASFEKVSYNEYALNVNSIDGTIENKVYEEGFHFIGLLNDFIRFPSTWTTIEFSPSSDANDIPIISQTKNGLFVDVDVSFQFRLRKADILQLYSEYGGDYSDYIEKVARSALRTVIGNYDAEQLYTNRTVVNAEMFSSMHNALDSIVEMGDFQLRDIEFPYSFKKAVEEYEVWRIQTEIARQEQIAELIRQETLTYIAEYTANRTIIEYEGLATALESLRQELNITQDQLLTYLWIETIQEHDESYLFIGLDQFPILIPTDST